MPGGLWHPFSFPLEEEEALLRIIIKRKESVCPDWAHTQNQFVIQA